MSAHCGQHALGVVPRLADLLQACLAVGANGGEDQGRLELRAGDGEVVLDSAQLPTGKDERRQRVVLPPPDYRAHSAQRLDDPSHRP